ncbi:CbbQ/NirQ/NorQ/GpvN family protein [Thiocystis minor]|uniref:AAA family ATPase n=1 Tax=Thiocystis minor TaxID=61597 RepID=UPI0019134E64|nr:AAA family ATPase [Thiocystis minor]MBK5965803.1 CbbQ/NirQ/NorQ/GpvN family protein [Thiocystis minor]
MTTTNTTKMFGIAEAFGVSARPELTIEGFADESHPMIPRKTEYRFRPGLSGLIAFLGEAAGDAFLLTGPTGSGKTSLVCQIAARLNWPVQSVTCHGRMELSDLVGQFVLNNGTTEFIHGPLAVAMKEGQILILNEIDLMDPSELAGLNDVIEGRPLVIAQNGGEVIRPHPKFRVFATGNSAGAGDTTGLYQGVLRQNLAFLDRFQVINVGYLAAEVELGVLQKAIPSLPGEIGEKMIAVANEIRRLFLGEGEQRAELTITMSTRTVIRWARLSLTFRGASQPIAHALEQALTNRADAEQREAIHRIAEDVMGNLWLGVV